MILTRRSCPVDVLLDVSGENTELVKFPGHPDRRTVAEDKNKTLHERYPELAGIRMECVNKMEC